MGKGLADYVAGIVLFAALLIGGVFFSIMVSIKVEAALGPGNGFKGGVTALLACWGCALCVLHLTLKRAIGGDGPPRAGR